MVESNFCLKVQEGILNLQSQTANLLSLIEENNQQSSISTTKILKELQAKIQNIQTDIVQLNDVFDIVNLTNNESTFITNNSLGRQSQELNGNSHLVNVEFTPGLTTKRLDSTKKRRVRFDVDDVIIQSRKIEVTPKRKKKIISKSEKVHFGKPKEIISTNLDKIQSRPIPTMKKVHFGKLKEIISEDTTPIQPIPTVKKVHFRTPKEIMFEDSDTIQSTPTQPIPGASTIGPLVQTPPFPSSNVTAFLSSRK